MNNEHVGEILQLSKLTEAINERRKDEKTKRRVRVVLICLGALTFMGLGAYIACKVCKCGKNRRCKIEYDLYDDLDEYYEEDSDDEADDETEEDEEEAASEESAG